MKIIAVFFCLLRGLFIRRRAQIDVVSRQQKTISFSSQIIINAKNSSFNEQLGASYNDRNCEFRNLIFIFCIFPRAFAYLILGSSNND